MDFINIGQIRSSRVNCLLPKGLSAHCRDVRDCRPGREVSWANKLARSWWRNAAKVRSSASARCRFCHFCHCFLCLSPEGAGARAHPALARCLVLCALNYKHPLLAISLHTDQPLYSVCAPEKFPLFPVFDGFLAVKLGLGNYLPFSVIDMCSVIYGNGDDRLSELLNT